MRQTKQLLSLLFVFLCTSITMQAAHANWSYKVNHLKGNDYQIILTANIDRGWHMYDISKNELVNPTEITFEKGTGYTLEGGVKQLNKPITVTDETLGGKISYFEGSASFAQNIKLTQENVTVKANVYFMTCDANNCTPPDDKDFVINVKAVAPIVADAKDDAKDKKAEEKKNEDATKEEVAQGVEELTDSATIVTPNTDTATDSIAAAPVAATDDNGGEKSNIWMLIIEAILWGFAALLTPCVFPMVPMTVSFFMKGNKSAAAGRFKALMYGIFIIVLYTAPIAIIIMVTKIFGGDTVTADIFNWIATSWVSNLLFFVIFMIFAASFFGAFEITMPSKLVNKTDENSDKGGLIGIFFMALTLVLVSFSCTGPIVGSVLIKSTQGEFWEPIITMFAFSVAFALPFTLFALFPSLLKNLPKSGGWLNSVKVVLGFLEVALGFKFLSVADQTYHWGLMDREVYLAVWIVTFSLLGLYLLGKIKFAHDSDVKHISVLRLALSIVTFTFVVYMIPGMWGAPLKALSGYMPPITTQDFILGAEGSDHAMTVSDNGDATPRKYADFLHLPHGIQGYFELNEAIAAAKKADKPLFVDVTGHGCVNCREMEARVWSDPRVLKLLKEDYVVVALYVDDKKEAPESDWVTNAEGKVLKDIGRINSYISLSKWGVNAQPNYVLLNGEGKQLAAPRSYDLDVEAFIAFLQKGIEDYKASK